MRKIYFMLLTVLFAAIANAQISVTVTGNTNTTPNLAASYPSLDAAITDLNLVTAMSGSVLFDLAAGGTENITSQLTITTAGDLSNSITFQKSGAGANPIVTRTDAGTNTTSTFGGLGDAVIRIDGTDNIHFNGLDIAASQQGIEYGYFTYKPSGTNGCQNVSISNCAITMTKGTSAYVCGIYISNGTTSVSTTTGVTVTANSGRNENITITGNTISNVHCPINTRGSSAAGFSDINLIVGQSGAGNTLQNFGGGSASTTYGVYMIYQANPTISYNTINNAGGGGSSHASILYGINHSIVSGNIVCNNNNLTLNNSSVSSTVYGIYNDNVGISESISNNTFNAGTISSTGTVYLIYASNSTVGTKTISNNSISGTINRSGASGTLYCYYNNGSPASGTETISNNNFSNVTLTGTSTFYGINSTTASGHAHEIFNNIISNISGGSGTKYGINVTAASSRLIYNNNIYDITSDGSVQGIANGSGGATILKIYNNKLYNLSSTSSAATAGLVTGILVSAGSTGSNAMIYNNLIGNLTAPNATGTDAIRGIASTMTTASTSLEVSYNTIHLNASSAGANFGTTGIYHTASATATTANLTMRNNIIYNSSIAAGTGIVTAYRRSSTNFGNFNVASNRNIFYGGSPSVSQLIYYDGTNSAQDIAAYQALVGGAEVNSNTENVNFQSTTGSSADFLKYNTAIASLVESGGSNIAGITMDYIGTIRQGNPGYLGTGTAPDIGAWELEGTAFAGCSGTPPASNTLTSDPTPCNGGDFTLSLSVVFGVGYEFQWQQSTTGAGGPFTDIPGAILSSLVTNTSVTTWYRSVVTCTISTLSTPSAPVQVTIATPLSGVYLIDNTGAGNYISFAAALTDLNCKGVGGPITFNVTAGQTFVETSDLEIIFTGSMTNTVTFQKTGAGANPKIQRIGTSATNDFILKLTGIDYYTFNGIDFEQTGTSSSDWVEYGIWITNSSATNGSQNNTIKNGIITLSNANSSARGIYMNQSTTAIAASGTNSTNRLLNMTITNSYVGYYFTGTSTTLDDANEINTESAGTSLVQNLGNGTVTGSMYGVFSTYQTNLKVMNTEFMNFSPGGTSLIYGITCQSSSSNTAEIAYNHIHDITGSGTINGIYFTSMSSASVHNNHIHHLTTNTATSSAIHGIDVSAAGSDIDIYNNVIHDIISNGLTTTTAVGIDVGSGLDINVYNNMISGIKASSSTTTTGGTRGISVTGGSSGGMVKIYFNTIYLNDVGTVAGYTSAGIHNSSTTPTLDIRNNIVVNKSDITTGTRVAAFWKTSTTDNINDNSNNNIYYAGVPDASHLIYYDGTNSAQTIGEYQLLVTLAESAAVTEDVTFQTITNGIIRPNTSIPTYVESGAQAIAGYTMDFEGDVRNATTPDIGADEGAFIVFVPPVPGCATYTGGPANGSTGICPYQTITFTWIPPTTGGSVSQGYDIHFGTTSTPPFVANTIGFSYSPSGLLPNTTYYWQIVPKNTGGTATGCAVFSFTTTDVGITSTTPGSVCVSGMVTLGATGTGTINWYAAPSGGTPLATGSTFVTPTINTTTTYYVSATSGMLVESAGKSAPASTTNTTGNNWGLVFDVVNAPITLNSVKIYSVGAAGVMSVELTDNTGTVITSAGPFNYAAGTTSNPTIETLTLNFNVPVGSGYRLVSASMSGGAVIRETSGNTYPYSSASGNVIVTSGFITNPGSTTYYWFYDWVVTTACESPRIPVVATVNSLPSVFNVTGGGAYCSGSSGVLVGLDGSETGVNYQLQIGGVNTGSPVAGTGAAISFGNQTAAGTYTVVATNTTTLCTNTMSGSVVVSITPSPAQYNVTGGGAGCSGSGITIGLDGSETGVEYQLQLGGVNTGSPVAGTGAAISFGNQTTAGTYTVIATNTTSFCSIAMNGSVIITLNPLPTQFNVTGGGGYCPGGSGVAVGLDGSESGVNYQLQLGGVNTGSPVAGTGAAISFGLQTATGTYTVVATNAATSCSNDMLGSVVVSINPVPVINYTVTEPTTCLSNDGVINLTITGASGPHTFNWSTIDGSGINQGAEDQFTLGIGTYTVLVTAANGCQATENITLIGPGGCFVCPTMSSLTANPSPACENGSVTLTASGLTSMGSTFGIEFKYSTSPLTDPYSGGTTIAVVPNGSLGSGGTTATTSTSFVTNGTYYIYAILSPVPVQPSCRPYVDATLVVNQAPTVTCPANVSVNNDAGQCGAIVNYPPATVTGIPAPTVTYSMPSGSFFPVGTTTVTVAATNSCGTATCTFTVTVNDTEPPYLGAGSTGIIPELFYYKFDGSGTTVPNLASAPPSGTATATIVGGQTQGTPALCGTGSLIGNGLTSTSNYVNTGWATNLSGMSWSISFKTANIPPSATLFYIFGDNTAGSFRCFTNGVAGANNWMLRGTGITDIIVPGGATVAAHTTTFVYDIGTGNIRGYLDGNLVATVSIAGSVAVGTGPFKVGGYGANIGLPSGGLMDEFALFNRALSPAEILQLASCPSSGPTLCPAPIVTNNDPGVCGAVVTFAPPVPTDNCPGVIVAQTGGLPSGSTFPVGTTTNIFTATDVGGNTATCSFTVTVNDTEPPSITCPANITTGNSPGQCGAVVNFAPTATDNCPGTITFISTPASGSLFPVGTTTVVVRATDASGNTATCSFTVTVNDTQPPTITCPANITVNNTPGQCAAVVNYNLPTATDNCALPGSISLTQNTNNTTITPLTGIACPTGDNHFWRAYTLALSGPLTITGVRFGVEVNGTAQVATVNIYTSAGPFPASPRTLVGSQTVNITTASGVFYTANFATPPTVPANAIVAIEVSVPTGGMWPGANTLGESAPAYISSATCGVANPVTLASLGFTSHTIIDLMGNVAGPSVFTLVSGLPSGSSFPIGTTTNVWRATDASGNTATCSFTVTVVDNQPPAISCPANITTNTPIGSCTAIVNYSVTATDNCPGVTTALVSGPASGSAFPLGTTTVVWRATDAAGNTSTCSFTVTVNDAQIPVISSQPQNTSVCEGSTATFNVTAAPLGGPNNLTYQWQVWNGTAWVNVTGATTPTLTVPNVTLAMNTRTYRVLVNGLCTQIISGMATLNVRPVPVVTLSTSRDPSLTPGQLVNITAAVSVTGGTIQWYKNGVPMPIGSVFTLFNLGVDDAGTYHAVYTAPNGCSATSNSVIVSKASSSDVFVYPNPSNGQFQVRVYTPNAQITITVYDSKGAMVYQRSESTGTTPYTRIDVNMSAMAAGQYLVEVRDSGGNKIGVQQIIVWR